MPLDMSSTHIQNHHHTHDSFSFNNHGPHGGIHGSFSGDNGHITNYNLGGHHDIGNNCEISGNVGGSVGHSPSSFETNISCRW